MMRIFHWLKPAFLATRPWSFPLTVISVTLGSVLAYQSGQFYWGRYVLLVLSMMLAHAASNLLNDYGDVRQGVDVPGAPTTINRQHPILEGDFSLETVLRMSITCFVAAALICGYFFLIHGWIILLFVILGWFGGIGYTTGPKYKYRAMGEVAVFFIWGPLMVSACYFAHTGNWERIGSVVLISIPHGLWVVLVLLANNLTDIDYDRHAGIRTLGTLLGEQKALSLYIRIVVILYSITGLEVLAGVIPVWGLLTCLSSLAAYRFIRRMQREPAVLADADAQTAKIATLYGILLIAALLIVTYLS